MELLRHDTPNGTVILRELTLSDIPELVELNKHCYPKLAEDNVVWAEGQLRNHLRVFPEGQIIAELNGRLVGATSSLIVSLGTNPYRAHTYAGVTDGGYFNNHDYNGDTLYGADVYVHPDMRGLKLGHALYEARRMICRRFNLRRILCGGRIVGYSDVSDKMTPEEYLEKVTKGELSDPVLNFQMREGFVVRDVLRHYIRDAKSRNCASLIEWRNPDYVEAIEERGKIRVACVQYAMRKVKTFEDFAAQVNYFAETAADYRADYVVFPEFFSVQLLSHLDALSSLEGIRKLSDFTDQFLELLSGLARKYNFHIIGGSHPVKDGDKLLNTSFLFRPDGSYIGQPKLHITPSEKKYWGITGGDDLLVIQTPKAKIGILICYDIEFPETARYLADQGVEVIFCPFCTDDRHGYLRVRYCAQARAIENQVYVVTSGVIGNLPDVPAMDIHYGQAAVFTPSDFSFARDGIQAQADSNIETMLVTDIDIESLYRSRAQGSVTPRLDRRKDLFELKANLKSSYSSDLDEPNFELPKE